MKVMTDIYQLQHFQPDCQLVLWANSEPATEGCVFFLRHELWNDRPDQFL